MSTSASPEPRTTQKKRRRLDETTAHRSQEKKRRQLINGSIARLKTLVPACATKRTTMINVLTATEEYVVAMQAREAELLMQLAAARAAAAGTAPAAPAPSASPEGPLRSATPPQLASSPASPAAELLAPAFAAPHAAPLALDPLPPLPPMPVLAPIPALAPLTEIGVIDPNDLRITLDKALREAPASFPYAAKASVSSTFALNFALPTPVYADPARISNGLFPLY